MDGKVVDDSECFAGLLIESEDTDLGIDRSDRCNLLVGWQGVGMTDVRFLANLEPQPAVFGDAIFVTGAPTPTVTSARASWASLTA